MVAGGIQAGFKQVWPDGRPSRLAFKFLTPRALELVISSYVRTIDAVRLHLTPNKAITAETQRSRAATKTDWRRFQVSYMMCTSKKTDRINVEQRLVHDDRKDDLLKVDQYATDKAILLVHAAGVVTMAFGPSSTREAHRQSSLHAAYKRNQALGRKEDCRCTPTQQGSSAGVAGCLFRTRKPSQKEKQEVTNLLRKGRGDCAEKSSN